MPVSETLEMRAQLTGALGLPPGYVIVKRRRRRRFARTERRGRRRPGPPARATPQPPPPGDAPLVELPFLFVEEFGLAELEQVARLLEAGMAGGAEAAARQRSRSS